MKRVHLCIFCPLLAAAVTALMLALTAAPHYAVADEAATDEAATEEAAADAKEDPFKIPDGDADDLAKFIHKLARTEPEGETDEELMAYGVKAYKTILTATERLLAAKPTEKQAADAFGFKLSVLKQLAQIEPEGDFDKQYAETAEVARADKREQVVAVGWQAYISDVLPTWDPADKAAKAAFLKEIVAKVEADGPQPMDVSIVSAIAGSLDRGDDEFVKELLEVANPIFEKSKDEDVKTSFDEANLTGFLRRLNLPGQPLEISGKLLDGEELDWKSYRGKVVLVDFWATWCGPCRDEVPNILEMYKAYHDKGFEVLGISLDATEEAAQSYIKDENIPWPSIFPEKKDERRWAHPLVKHYGITGIPMAILVDKEGKVVHMNARGPNLPEELQKLLGEPLTPPTDEVPAEDPATK